MRVVYNSFDGRYADNPRAIFEMLASSRPDITHTWLVDARHAHGFPADVETVTYGGDQCRTLLEAADVVVSNTHIEVDWDKAARSVYLQTWHGTPLKHIHFDSLWAPPGRVDYLTEDVRRWDYLLSPNAASTEPLRGAFGFAGEIVETGYPRNDILTSSRRRKVRDDVRAELNIPDGCTAVLYTPTWRDDFVDEAGELRFALQLDVDEFTARLGSDHVLLLRLHSLVSNQHPPTTHPVVRDVSFYPDVSKLYLAADVMVTDYSSTMFDFAVTGKPMVFYAYDLEHYRDSLRGFYFDLLEHAPGPVVRSTSEVVDVIADLGPVVARYAERYALFRDRFCHLDDGLATGRVIRRFFPDGGPNAASAATAQAATTP